MNEICLVQMPYTLLYTPSLALGLLKAELLRAGHPCRVVYGDLIFCKETGLTEYLRISGAPIVQLLGEMSWADAAWGKRPWADYDGYLDAVSFEDGAARKRRAAELERAAEAAVAFADRLAREIVAQAPPIVGCSSSFQQNNASFALLRRIKELNPSIITIMGGSGCACGAGAAIAREIPWIDYVFSGDGDETLPAFCGLSKIYGKEIPLSLLPPGVLCRENAEDGEAVPYAMTRDLNQLPLPDFSEYFSALNACGLQGKFPVYLVAEGSRGCWWNEKRGCTFCGLCVEGDHYREKTADRLFREFVSQSARYGTKDFFLTDCILSPRHMKALPPLLRAMPDEKRPAVISEVKSNMSRGMMYRLREAGFELVQPGIESLQDDMLLLMNKGNTAIRHVELLKSARSCGMALSWNILAGFPGEQEEWIDEMTALFPLLTHLPPPNWATHILFQRNNYYQRHPQTIGYPIRPMAAYGFAYAHNPALVRELSYNFEPVEEARRPGYYDLKKKGPCYRRLCRGVAHWQERYFQAKDRFQMQELPDRLELLDLREAAVRSVWTLRGLERDLYLFCEKPQEMNALYQQFPGRRDEVGRCVDFFCESRLMLRVGTMVLALAARTNQIPSRPKVRG